MTPTDPFLTSITSRIMRHHPTRIEPRMVVVTTIIAGELLHAFCHSKGIKSQIAKSSDHNTWAAIQGFESKDFDVLIVTKGLILSGGFGIQRDDVIVDCTSPVDQYLKVQMIGRIRGSSRKVNENLHGIRVIGKPRPSPTKPNPMILDFFKGDQR